ncbi:MAG: phosphatidate cytidylyltransferase, partial [Caldilineaceae bacterium]|nr:phosphatidate cytidylyltransferase [Caldilineaceae bacterium]
MIVSLAVIPPVLIALWLGGIWWAALIVLVSTLGGIEFYGLMRVGGYRPDRPVGLIWLLLIVLSHWSTFPVPLLTLLTAGFILTLIRALYQKQQPLTNWTITAAGAIYIGVMLGQALALRLLPNGLWWVLLALFVTWANDTFAYFVGITIGRHKIWPRLSPKKSWEGTIGGWIFAAAIGSTFAYFTPIVAGPLIGALSSLGGGVLALFGDLAISMLKRQVGAKDSGIVMPG